MSEQKKRRWAWVENVLFWALAVYLFIAMAFMAGEMQSARILAEAQRAGRPPSGVRVETTACSEAGIIVMAISPVAGLLAFRFLFRRAKRWWGRLGSPIAGFVLWMALMTPGVFLLRQYRVMFVPGAAPQTTEPTVSQPSR